jgi:hypothetical protein
MARIVLTEKFAIFWKKKFWKIKWSKIFEKILVIVLNKITLSNVESWESWAIPICDHTAWTQVTTLPTLESVDWPVVEKVNISYGNSSGQVFWSSGELRVSIIVLFKKRENDWGRWAKIRPTALNHYNK